MRHLINLVEQTLVEMIIRHQDANPSVIVAYRDSIWLLGEDDEDTAVYSDIKRVTGIDAHDIQSLMDERQERPDVLITYYDSTPSLDGVVQATSLNPTTSLLLKKVAKQLGLDGYDVERIDYDGGERTDHYPAHELEGKYPQYAYHGTSSEYIYDIIRLGLRPDTEHGNWEDQGLKFHDRVFLTSSLDLAFYHANHAVAHNHFRPIVVKVKIPDPRLIDQDFDVAMSFYGYDNENVHHTYQTAGAIHNTSTTLARQVRKHNPKTDYSRETGVFSYRGRIPGSFIRELILPSNSESLTLDNDYHEENFARFLDNLDYLQDYGFYDPVEFQDMRDEADEDEEEDYDPTAGLDDED